MPFLYAVIVDLVEFLDLFLRFLRLFLSCLFVFEDFCLGYVIEEFFSLLFLVDGSTGCVICVVF